MPVNASWLPIATPLDPSEEPAGGIDPLGTLAYAERLGEALLRGFTARMWRGRLLTFATVAAFVADETVERLGNREDLRLEARLAFERLFVSAVVRMGEYHPTTYGNASIRLPGRDLAKKAQLARQPLTRANFLKGEAVNGPFGVIARLARDLKLIDEDGRSGNKALEVMMAWSADEHLPGVLDWSASTDCGAKWMADAIKCTADCVSKRKWPGDTHPIWEQVAHHLRPDRIGPRERRALLALLEEATVRRRVIRLLRGRVDMYRQARDLGDRGKMERSVLLRGLQPELSNDQTDRHIGAVIEAVDAYEQIASLLQQGFDGIMWELKRRGGRARPEDILEDQRLRQHLETTRIGLTRAIPILRAAADCLRDHLSVDPSQFCEPLLHLGEDAIGASVSVGALADAVLRRHEGVQRNKGKAPWIEYESHWTLLSGENRVDGDSPPIWQGTYLHPFKISNAYYVLGDLGQVVIDDRDAEE